MTDNELPPIDADVKKILEWERNAPPAPNAARGRVLDAVHRTLEIGPFGGGDGAPSGGSEAGPSSAAGTGAGASSSAATAATSGAAGVGLSLPAATVIFALGAISGAGIHAVLRAPEVKEIRVEVPVPAPPTVDTKVEPPRPPPSPVERPKALTEDSATIRPEKRRRPRTVESAPRKEDTLKAERVLLERARTALAKKDPNEALRALEDHASRFAEGQLREERRALEVQALVSLGRRDQAEDRASAFRRDYPHSLFRPIVDEALER